MTEKKRLIQARARARQMSDTETSIAIYVVYDPSYHRSRFHPYRLLGPCALAAEKYQDSAIVAVYQDADELV